MMQLFPVDAVERLEFHKVCALLREKCRTELAREQVAQLRFHTRKDYLEEDLSVTEECTFVYSGPHALPLHYTNPLSKELKLLSLTNAVLMPEQLLELKKLSLSIKELLQWYKHNHTVYPRLSAMLANVTFEKKIEEAITVVIDDNAVVKDNASAALSGIRSSISQQRTHLRKVFESILRKLGKQGYLADINESFLNGRRTVAVQAEHKRIVKGILHGESDSGKTVFIEPEETIALNNEMASLLLEEKKELHRILQSLTRDLSPYHVLLESWYQLIGQLDFVRAKAGLALDMNAHKPQLSPHPGIELIKAYHPLLYLQHKALKKETIPTTLQLNRKERILIISGPNSGGKTVAMKTVGLLQLMTQAAMLIPADPTSVVGIYKQIFIHIGDTQSIEHELSTYSAHLRDMKYFTEFANGKTLFFIDELGSGSDPNLGGAFAEAIVEELSARHAQGIITTHYLNLKVMAGKVPGIMNGAMAFDEERLLPLYQLTIGKPGSSYTFAIAQRNQLAPKLIARAKNIADRGHFKLDKMLLQTEQQAIQLTEKEKQLHSLLRENEQLKKRYEQLIDKEEQRQHFATLKLQNKIKKEELDYLRETERKLKQVISDWKRTEDKQSVINAAEKVLFKKRQIQANEASARKADKHYDTIGGQAQVGDLVRNQQTHQVGTVKEIKEQRSTVMIGKMPFIVNLEEWVVVRKKEQKRGTSSSSKK